MRDLITREVVLEQPTSPMFHIHQYQTILSSPEALNENSAKGSMSLRQRLKADRKSSPQYVLDYEKSNEVAFDHGWIVRLLAGSIGRKLCALIGLCAIACPIALAINEIFTGVSKLSLTRFVSLFIGAIAIVVSIRWADLNEKISPEREITER